MISCGIDSGSRTTKLVLVESKSIIYSEVQPTGISPEVTADEIFQRALQHNHLNANEFLPVIVTGYGRNLILEGRKKIAEISCHGKGVNYYFPEAELIIDIGGQDSKGILVSAGGKVLDFVMNDRCAAGTGRFLEKVAGILELRIGELGGLALKSQHELEINNTCVVFAESEMIGMIAQGKNPADIAMSVHRSIARRIANMIASFPQKSEVIFTGGVALNAAMIKCLQEELNAKVKVPENPFLTGALGAALFAQEQYAI